MALLEKIGYGQVEFNKVNSQVTKEIISNLPADDSIETVQMGMFLVPDYTNAVFKLPALEGDAAYIINNEIKNYDVRQSRKDFRLEKIAGNAHYVPQEIYPKGYKMTVGDILHLNLIDGFTGESNIGDTFVVGTNGYLVKANTQTVTNASLVFAVEKISSMPDGQLAPKLVCIKANY